MRWMLGIVLLVVLLVPEGAMSARWEKDTVPVWSFVPDDWQALVENTVRDFNAHLPPSAPRLVYTPMGEKPCEQLPFYGRKGGISVCLGPMPPARPAWSPKRISGDRFVSGLIGINTQTDLPPDPSMLPAVMLCHEMMHVVTDAPDGFDDQGRYNYPHPDTSCVQGYLDHLGSWDIAYAESVYPFPNGHRHKRRHR